MMRAAVALVALAPWVPVGVLMSGGQTYPQASQCAGQALLLLWAPLVVLVAVARAALAKAEGQQ